MNYRRNILNALPIVIVLLFAVSCGKKQAPQTIADRMVGKWELTQTGSDDNFNGKVDSYEIFPVTQGEVYYLTFKNDATGVQTSANSINLAFRWQLLAYDSVRIFYAANDTVTYYIQNSTPNSLTFETTTSIENSNKTVLQLFYFTRK